jgi:hypothetical protein
MARMGGRLDPTAAVLIPINGAIMWKHSDSASMPREPYSSRQTKMHSRNAVKP